MVEIDVVVSDKLPTLRFRSGKIDAVKGHRYDGPGVEVIIINDAIATRLNLHDSSPVAVCENKYSERGRGSADKSYSRCSFGTHQSLRYLTGTSIPAQRIMAGP